MIDPIVRRRRMLLRGVVLGVFLISLAPIGISFAQTYHTHRRMSRLLDRAHESMARIERKEAPSPLTPAIEAEETWREIGIAVVAISTGLLGLVVLVYSLVALSKLDKPKPPPPFATPV